jgi:hypothetical protein
LKNFCDDAGEDMGAAQVAELAVDNFLNNIISYSPSTVEILTCQVSTSLRLASEIQFQPNSALRSQSLCAQQDHIDYVLNTKVMYI